MIGLGECRVVYDALDECGSSRHCSGRKYADEHSHGGTYVFYSEVGVMVGEKESREGDTMRRSTT
jgi:hypothetical protein